MLARHHRLIWRKSNTASIRKSGFASSVQVRLPRATDSRPGLDGSNPRATPGAGGEGATAVGDIRTESATEKPKGISFISSRPPSAPSRGRKPASAPPPPPKPKLPPSFASTYLSTQGKDLESRKDSDPDPFFIESLHGHLLTSFLPHNQLLDGPDPTVAVVCPHEGGEHTVRRTVEAGADLAGADVLRIDAIEVLGLAEWGALGQAGSIVNLTQNPLHINVPVPSTPSDDAAPELPQIFGRPPSDDLEESEGGSETFHIGPAFSVSALPFSPPPGSLRGPGGGSFGVLVADSSDTKERASLDALFEVIVGVTCGGEERTKEKPRVIYIQDAAAMASTFAQWWPSLLKAVRGRRRSGSGSGEGLVAPTTIVLGVSPSLLHVGTNLSTMEDKGQRGRQRRNGGLGDLWESSEEEDVKGRHLRLSKRLESFRPSDETALRNLIPPFGDEHATSTSGPSEERPFSLSDIISNIRGSNRASSASSPNSSKPDDVNLWKVVGTLPQRRNVKLERSERLSRRTSINHRLLSRALGQRGATATNLLDGSLDANKVAETAREEMESLEENFGFSVWPLKTLEHLASIAIARILGSDHPPDVLEIGWAALAEASLREEAGDRVASAFIDRVKAHQMIATKHHIGEKGQGAKPKAKMEDELVAKLRKDKSLNEHERKLLDCVVDINKVASTKFEDVILPESTIDGIRSVVSLPIMYPEAYRKGILASHSTSGVLMFGPPGTGKSLAARALASESGARMLALNPSDLNQMYVGVSEKIVKAAFTLARKLSPAIIFIDEADNLLGGRSGGSFGGANVQRQILGEMLQAMDGLNSAAENRESNVVVIAATNRPFDIDEAMLRRLPRRVLVDLPSQKERRDILRSHLREEVLGDDVDLDALAKRTDTYSGSDLKHVCVNAALAALKETIHIPWKVDSPPAPMSLATPATSAEEASGEPVEREVLALPVNATEPITIQQPILAPRAASATDLEGADGPEPETARQVEQTIPTAQNNAVQAPDAEMLRLLDEVDSYPRPDPVEVSSSKTAEAISAVSAAGTDRVLRSRHFDIALREITPSSSEQGNLAELRKWAEQYGEGGTKRGKKGAYGAKFGFGLGQEETDDPTFGRVRPAET